VSQREACSRSALGLRGQEYVGNTMMLIKMRAHLKFLNLFFRNRRGGFLRFESDMIMNMCCMFMIMHATC
jgi:hypothetical protein